MRRYRAPENLCYFCTRTVVDWIPIFIDKRYVEPILSSLTFCREKKGLTLYGFVIMPNHLHLLAEAGEQLEAVMRDFKRFNTPPVQSRTSSELKTALLFCVGYQMRQKPPVETKAAQVFGRVDFTQKR